MYMKINFIYLGIALLLASACAVQRPSDHVRTALVGKQWQLVELNGKPVPASVNGKMPFLKLEEQGGRYSASGGCNGIGGEYTLLKGNGIKFSRGMSTMMACPDMEVEDGLRGLFDQADTYVIHENTMSLSKGTNQAALAKFVPVLDQSDNLAGAWDLEYIAGSEDEFTVLYPERKPSMTVDVAGGKVNGNSSCNSFSSTLEIDGQAISFGPIMSTKMACPGNGEHVFLKNLERVTNFSIQESTLSLMDKDTVVMRWKKQ